jgi:phospholipid/cholesterol/gamma-HCH transport system substrate-binding protein
MANPLRRGIFEWRQVRVAALALVALLLLIYGVVRVGRIFDVFADRYEVVTLVPSALGLREGAPVTLAGQRIGQVSDIEFIPVRQKTGAENLRVRLAITERVRDQIRADSRAFLRTQGLLGDKFVDIEPGSVTAQVLQPGDTLVAGPSVDIDQFVLQASTALDQATAIVTDMRELAGGLARGEGTLGQFLTDEQLYTSMVGATAELQRTLVQVNRADGTFGRLLRDPEMYQHLNRAVARVDSIGEVLLNGSGTAGLLLRDDALYRNLAGSTARADSALGGITAMLEQLRTGDGSLQKLLADPDLYDQFLKAVVDLQALLNDVRQSPDKYKPNIRVDVF